MILNEFTLKAAKAQLNGLGYKNFEYYKMSFRDPIEFLYCFKFIYKNTPLYYQIHYEENDILAENFFEESISEIIEAYEDVSPNNDKLSDYIKSQVIDKLGFDYREESLDFSNLLLYSFFNDLSYEYNNLQEFMNDIDNYDFVSIMRDFQHNSNFYNHKKLKVI